MTRTRGSSRRDLTGAGVVCAATAVLLAMSPMAAPAHAAPEHLREAVPSGEGFSGGDPNATGRAELRIRPALERVCFHITFKKLVHPNYGSIHSGPKNASYGRIKSGETKPARTTAKAG